MLKRLRYFVAVAELEHFGRAATQLRISQPPLSRQIRQFEQEVGATLFVRTTRRVELTDAGRLVLSGARRMLHELDEVFHQARMVELGEHGMLRIGFVTTATHRALPELLKRFRRRVPAASVQLSHLTSVQQLHALRAGQIDIGILRGQIDSALESAILDRERLFVALPSSHRLATRRSLSIAEFRAQPFVMWDRLAAAGMFDLIHRLCGERGFEPKVALEVTHPPAMLGLVAAGIGVSIVPESATHSGPTGVAFVPVSDRDARAVLAMAWAAGNASPLCRRFVELATVRRPSGTPRGAARS